MLALQQSVTTDISVAELEAMSSQELRELFADHISATVRGVVLLANIVKIFDDRGEDLSDIRIGMLNYLRLVAHGQLIPEVLVKFSGLPLLLAKASSLPIPEQQKVVSVDGIEVVEFADDGSVDRRKIPTPMLSDRQVRQVFGRGQLRNEEEQILYLRDRASSHRNPPAPDALSGVVIDTKRCGIWVNGYFIRAVQLLDYAKAAMKG